MRIQEWYCNNTVVWFNERELVDLTVSKTLYLPAIANMQSLRHGERRTDTPVHQYSTMLVYIANGTAVYCTGCLGGMVTVKTLPRYAPGIAMVPSPLLQHVLNSRNMS